MNFSSLRDIYLDWHLRILGHEDPSSAQDSPLFFPRHKARVVTCQQVLDKLNDLPDLSSLKALQASQQRVRLKPNDVVSRKLKLFCRCAGGPLIRAFEILANLRKTLELISPEVSKSKVFRMNQWLIEALLEVRKSHAIWEVSVGHEAFFKKHPRPRAVRFEYLWYTLQLVYIVAGLTFPWEFREYLQQMGSALDQHDWRENFILDSHVTYERSRAKTRSGLIAPVNQYPKKDLLYGQTVLRPFLVYNPSVYGHRLVPNERSLQLRNGALRCVALRCRSAHHPHLR